jgi:hypothetical protein
MEYQPYQHSFDGYGPADYSELDDGPPGIVEPPKPQETFNSGMSGPPPHGGYGPPANNDSTSGGGVKRVSAYDPHLVTESASMDTSMTEDDMDDLRMLGIDVEDAAAANFK